MYGYRVLKKHGTKHSLVVYTFNIFQLDEQSIVNQSVFYWNCKKSRLYYLKSPLISYSIHTITVKLKADYIIL